jgi:hypothetical protein
MMRECHVRICERLGVKFLGPTRHSRRFKDAARVQATCQPELPRARFVERSLNQKAGIAVAKLIRQRERLLQVFDDLAAFVGCIARGVHTSSLQELRLTKAAPAAGRLGGS